MNELEILNCEEKIYNDVWNRYKEDLKILFDQSNSLEVIDEESSKQALSMALQSRKLEQTVNSSRKKILQPYTDYIKDFNTIVKDIQEKLKNMELDLRYKIEKYLVNQNENPFSTVNEIKVEDGSLKFHEEWDFEIIDERLIPDDCKEISEIRIQNLIENGIRHISGVRIFKTTKTTMRIKN